LFAVISVSPATAAKKPRSCTLLKPTQMAKVLDAEVGTAGKPGTGGYACPFVVGKGLGEPGGGLVVVTYYGTALAKNLWKTTKGSTEAIQASKARFDADAGAAYVYKHRQLVGVSVSFTSNQPSSDELLPQMGALAELAAKKL
jgi:hypothetical protein